jgi:hypothetical protein
VQFYRLRSAESDETLPPQEWGQHLEAIGQHERARTAGYEASDGMVLLGRVVRNDTTKALALYVIRYNDLPARERGGEIGQLHLADDEGLAEPIHVVFYSANVIGVLYNHHGPRVRRLADYLNEKCGMSIIAEPIVRLDALDVLQRFTSLWQVHLRLSEHHLDQIRSEETLYEAITNVNRLGGGILEIGLKFDADKREAATAEWRQRFQRLLSGRTAGLLDRGAFKRA